jgi:putative DNA primase/helicase
MVPKISSAERDVLYQAARKLNEWEDPKPTPAHRPVPSGRRDRPGDDFNARANWADILEPHGWTRVGVGADGIEYWRRPGKTERGTSATVNYEDSGVFYVFSTAADPFEELTGYSKFHAHVLLNHNGDFKAAARGLAQEGFGRSHKHQCKNQSARSRRRGTRKHRVHVRR